MIHVIYLTGVSGAGRTSCAHAFEERGYRVIENFPNEVLPALLKNMKQKPDSYGKTVLIQEIRHAKTGLDILKNTKGIRFTSIALDCKHAELLRRYRLTRHIHPLQSKGYMLEEAIAEDEREIRDIREDVDIFIDTTEIDEEELKESIFFNLKKENESGMAVSFMSFGYKHGLPTDADFIFDCRDLPNPYWVEELRDYTGLDQPVIDFFKSKRDMGRYIKEVEAFITAALERAHKNGRKFVTVYLGCTGGQHRSVYVANALYEAFSRKYYCMIYHRDISKQGKDK